jgi:membrane-associated phospholipid phosphatase
MRVAADRHWLSDVAVGALVGSGIGVAIPMLAHRYLRHGERVCLVVVPGGVALGGVF